MRDELGTKVDLLVERVSAKSDWSDVLRLDPCAYCGYDGGTVDHIEPRGRGGPYAPSRNGTGSCSQCNNAKANTSLLLFLRHFAVTRERQRAYDALQYRTGETRRQRAARLRQEQSYSRTFFSESQLEAIRNSLGGGL